MLDGHERLEIFLDRLARAPPAKSHDDARELLNSTLDGVEDEFSGVPNNPGKYLSDGRLYPPQDDSFRKVTGRTDVVRYRSRWHDSWIASNGAIRIETINKNGTRGICCLDKPGTDGKRVTLP
jgi:hypothetical protein